MLTPLVRLLALAQLQVALAQLQVDVGVTCPEPNHASATDAGLREECDHVHFMLKILNNKTDGFLDELLPRHTIALVEVDETAAGGAVAAFERLTNGSHALPAVIGGWYSSYWGQYVFAARACLREPSLV